MSALEVSAVPSAPRSRSLHVVQDDEVSARVLRLAHSREVAKAHAKARAAALAGRGLVVAALASAWITMIYAFLAVPNLPIP